MHPLLALQRFTLADLDLACGDVRQPRSVTPLPHAPYCTDLHLRPPPPFTLPIIREGLNGVPMGGAMERARRSLGLLLP